MSTSVAALRELLEQRFPDAAPLTQRTTEPVATGISALDQILPGGGLPRARMSVWTPLGGASAILRAACHAAIGAGERTVWIDGPGTIAGAFWETGPLLLRPRGRIHTLRAAEEVLQSGAVGLVVLAGVEPQGTEIVRLTRAAREGGAALVMLAAATSMAALRLTSRLMPNGYHWRRDPFGGPAEAQMAVALVRARAVGWNVHTKFEIPVMPHDLRLSLEPGVADRRGLRR